MPYLFQHILLVWTSEFSHLVFTLRFVTLLERVMCFKKKNFITLVTLQLLVCFETTESTGICKFAEMFPSKACESCFQPKTTKEDKESVSGPECPPNKVYGNCSSQRSCDDPRGQKMGSINAECLEPKICICADGFLKNGDNCLTPSECGCYIADDDLIIAEKESYIDVACSKKCICKNDQVICNTDYECNPYATCRVETGLRQCYCNEGYEGDGETCTPLYTDCYDAYKAYQTQNGVYTILPRGWPGSPFNVYCDMSTTGGGWTVFQRRVNGVTDFYRNCTSYRNGFGSVQHGHDFWLGNEQLHYLTSFNQRSYKLRVDIATSNGEAKYAESDSFRIDSEQTKYRLVDIDGHTGTAQPGMAHTKGRPFSTYVNDNDGCGIHNCAMKHRGAWWHNMETTGWCTGCYPTHCNYFKYNSGCSTFCTMSNLNGDYNGGIGENIFWGYVGGGCNLMSTEMKVRPVE